MGSPGSGKGTQAELVSEKFDVFHFDTGRFLERLFHFSGDLQDNRLQKEKKLFDTGILNSPDFVLEKVQKKVTELASNDIGLVFSGSPRTVYEAFNEEGEKGLMDTLEESYGKDSVVVFFLDVPEEEATRRNSNRLICSICGSPILSVKGVEGIERCPFCGGELRKRVLDDPETMKVRLKEFHERTQPVLDGLKERGYTINQIDGSMLPYKVFESISSVLEKYQA